MWASSSCYNYHDHSYLSSRICNEYARFSLSKKNLIQSKHKINLTPSSWKFHLLVIPFLNKQKWAILRLFSPENCFRLFLSTRRKQGEYILYHFSYNTATHPYRCFQKKKSSYSVHIVLAQKVKCICFLIDWAN